LNQNRLDESIAFFEKYLEFSPDEPGLHVTLGDIYYHMKDYWKAISQYEKYISRNPGQHEAVLRLADCYFNLGKLDSAILGYKAVLKTDPENKIARNRLEEIARFNKPVGTQ
jgi:tetratricopeptide (TPR) repeat protein